MGNNSFFFKQNHSFLYGRGLILSNVSSTDLLFSLNSELREYVKTDTDFDAIRGDQRFKDLIDNK